MKRHLETIYNDYAAAVLPPDTEQEKREETRTAFMAGSIMVLYLLDVSVDKVTTGKEIQAEIDDYIKGVIAAKKVKS